VGPQSTFIAVDRNGINSGAFGAWGGSYSFIPG
jgi:hypothetical protein